MSLTDDIRKLQVRVGAVPDGNIGPVTIAAINRALDGGKPAPPKGQTARKITTIAVHCSATPEGKSFTVKDIDRWHREQGWNEIGYNAVVLLDGTIEQGRDEAKVPSHVAGHNANSIAICYIGGVGADGKPKDTRTAEQRAALKRWLKEKKAQYPGAVILGHSDYPGVKKACPSFRARRRIRQPLRRDQVPDITPPVEQPVIIAQSALPEASMTLLRYVLVAAGGVLVTQGYIDDRTLNDVVAALLIILPTLYGLFRTKRNHAIKVTLADKLPDRAARVE